jgi:hypothetical protein
MQMEISVVKKNLLLLFLIMPSWRKNGQVRKEEPLFCVETHVSLSLVLQHKEFLDAVKSLFSREIFAPMVPTTNEAFIGTALQSS